MKRGLFLDRDGVINIDRGYVHRIEAFKFVPGIFDICQKAQTTGFVPIIITNQAGIGRGYYTEEDFQRLTAWMLKQFRMHGIEIGRVYHCPYHPMAAIEQYRRDSFDRKPNPGMILRAKKDFGLDLPNSVLVGDKESDLEAGRAAGVGYNLRLLHEIGRANAPDRLEFASLYAIGDWLERTFGRAARG